MQIKIFSKGAAMSFEQLQLKNQLCHRLYMASNSIARTYRTLLIEINLTYPQYVVMMALWEEDKISIAALIEKTAIDGSALTQILKKMADKALLTVIKDESDKRKRHIQLTTQGLSIKHQAADIPKQIQCKFNSIDSAQAEQLMHLLDLVVHDLNNEEVDSLDINEQRT